MLGQPDTIYKKKKTPVQPFLFDNQVAGVFTDMAQRSIPGYDHLLHTFASFLPNLFDTTKDSLCYDLGCSLGAASICIARHVPVETNLSIVAIDNSEHMIERLSQLLQQDANLNERIQPVCADIDDYKLSPCSLVVLHYTLQFIAPAKKSRLIDKIYNALEPNGWLFIAEKISPSTLLPINQWHVSFKKHQGYSDLEIAQKRQALEEVMHTETITEHTQRLNNAGFTQVGVWHQALNFVGMAAQK